MRRTYRYDADLDAVVEVHSNANYFEERPQGPSIISDDLGAGVNGLRNHADGRMYDGKSAFRQATRDAGCVEVGNEVQRQKPPETPKHEIAETIKRAFEEERQFGSDTAKRAKMMERR